MSASYDDDYDYARQAERFEQENEQLRSQLADAQAQARALAAGRAPRTPEQEAELRDRMHECKTPEELTALLYKHDLIDTND